MHWLQNHWYRITPLHLILLPVSLLFRALVAIRRALYRSGILSSLKLPVPVIVVGNISVGGTGKTPLTLALTQQLIAKGLRPLIVSRGYGGTNQFPMQVTQDSTAQQVGDEPLLMGRRALCPVWIGRDRAVTALAALNVHPQCDVVVCDDGLQHYRLQRDIEIAVVDGARGFGNGLMLPAGPLREPVSRLSKLDAVVTNQPAPVSSHPSRCDTGKQSPLHFDMHLTGKLFHNLLNPALTVDATYFQTHNNHAVAGIGNPQRYFKYLKMLGLNFAEHAFPDHHAYTAEDFAFNSCDAILLTEKDAVKCTAFADSRYWVLRVDAEIEASLIDHLLRKLIAHGPKAA